MPGTILVVEDEEEYRSLLQNVLGGAGYEVVAAANGCDGLALFDSAAPDLVLLDVVLPDMLGFDFCKKVRARARKRGTPILFCTVRSAAASLEQGLSLGSSDYVLKPFSPKDLLERVRAALRAGSP